MFHTDLYVRIHLDRFIVRNVRTAQTVEASPTESFSHPRALIGNFSVADATLKQTLSQLKGNWLSLRTRMLLHPCARLEGGLTQIEERALQELGRGAGANRVVLWLGDELSDAEVIERLY